MLEVRFKDGRKTLVDADQCFTPEGTVVLTKRDKANDCNITVASYPTMTVKSVDAVVVSPVKVIAMQLLRATSKTEAHGSRKLCQIAGIEYSDLVIPVLKKLREAGKVSFDAGKWTRV